MIWVIPETTTGTRRAPGLCGSIGIHRIDMEETGIVCILRPKGKIKKGIRISTNGSGLLRPAATRNISFVREFKTLLNKMLNTKVFQFSGQISTSYEIIKI